jgi:hypothetical protein
MFGCVSFLAVGCGLLIYATPFLSRVTLTATLVLLLASVLAAACHTGERRMFWAGSPSLAWRMAGSSAAPGNRQAVTARCSTGWQPRPFSNGATKGRLARDRLP